MKYLRLPIISLTLILLAGCATLTPDIAVEKSFWQNKNQVVAVATTVIPKPSTHMAGSQGLLDVAINNAMAGELSNHLQTLDTSDINKLEDDIATYLSKKGFKVKRIPNQVNLDDFADFKKEKSGSEHYAVKDFRQFKSQYGADKLVLISAVRLGTVRNYYGFIPTSSPTGLSHLRGQIINLDTNQLEWNQTVEQTVPFEGEEWDTPPNYPSLSKAVNIAIAQSKQILFNHFVQ
jgi:hypothetical protein